MSEATHCDPADIYKYWAFISYSHQDNLRTRGDGSGDHIQWANWLHEQLETFRIPDGYRERITPTGEPMPERFFPAFRDEAELPTSHDLDGQIRDALERSRYLIVIASPRSARSRYVNEEVRYFRQLGRGDRILTLIVDGEPNVRLHPKAGWTAGDDCFCPALVHPLRLDGEVDTTRLLPEEPIAADVRVKDAERTRELCASERDQPARRALLDFMKLKLIAGLMGAGLDELVQRDKVRQGDEAKKRNRTLRRWLAAVGALGLLAVAASVLAWRQRGIAEHRRGEAEKAQVAAAEAERRTKLRASKADTDVALELASRGEDAHAFALAVRALELDEGNQIAAILAFRLLADGRIVLPDHLLTQHSVATDLAFSRDGEHLAIGCDDGSVSVTDLAQGKNFTLRESFGRRVEKIAFSPDGASLALASNSQIFTWAYASSDKAVTVSKDFTNFDVLDLSWPQTDRIVVHSGRTWGSANRLTQVLGLAGQQWSLVFGVGDGLGIDGAQLADNDRRRIIELARFKTWVAGPSGLLVIHDIPKHRLVWLDLHSPSMNQPKFSVTVLDKIQVFVAEDNGVAVFVNSSTPRAAAETGLVFEWLDPGTQQQRLVHVSKGAEIESISADGERLLLSTPAGAALVETRSGKPLLEHYWKNEGAAKLLSFEHAGSSWVLVSRQPARQSIAIIANVFNRANLRERSLSLPSHIAYLRSAYSSSQNGLADFDPAGKWLAIASADNSVRVWPRAALIDTPYSLASPDSNKQLRGSKGTVNTLDYELDDGAIYRRDPKTGQRTAVSRLQKSADVKEEATGHNFSPDGRRIAVSYGSTSDRPDNNAPSVAILYDTGTGRIVGSPLRHDDDVFSPCFAPNGKWFVTASDDCTVRRWDTESGASIGKPLRLPSRVRFVQVSPTSDLIVTSTGHLIDATKWMVSSELTPAPQEIERAFFSPDGLWLVTVSGSFYKTGDGEQLDYTALNQWEISTGIRIAEPIEVTQHTGLHWLKPGESLVTDELVWQCVFPCAIHEILPLLQACRPLNFNAAGERMTNRECSLRSLRIEQFFPHGRTAHNAAVYDLAQRILRSPPK